MAEWNHPVFETRKVHLWMCVDEAAQCTVVWAGGQQVGNIDDSRVLELLQERWISVFGRMHTLRTDPARTALERPDLKSTEVLATAVLAHVRGSSPAQWALGRAPNWDQSFFDSGNETPDPSILEHLQGMETARDAWLKARNEERLKRNRPLAQFRPGDEVDFWTRGKRKSARPHIKGSFHGGAVVLATSTEIDEDDGSRKPRKVF